MKMKISSIVQIVKQHEERTAVQCYSYYYFLSDYEDFSELGRFKSNTFIQWSRLSVGRKVGNSNQETRTENRCGNPNITQDPARAPPPCLTFSQVFFTTTHAP